MLEHSRLPNDTHVSLLLDPSVKQLSEGRAVFRGCNMTKSMIMWKVLRSCYIQESGPSFQGYISKCGMDPLNNFPFCCFVLLQAMWSDQTLRWRAKVTTAGVAKGQAELCSYDPRDLQPLGFQYFFQNPQRHFTLQEAACENYAGCQKRTGFRLGKQTELAAQGLTCCLLLFSVAARPASRTTLLAPLLLFLSTLLLASENWHLWREGKETQMRQNTNWSLHHQFLWSY